MIILKVESGVVTVNKTLRHGGGPLQLFADGTFGGATIGIEISKNGVDYIDVSEYSKTAPNSFTFNGLIGPQKYRMTVSGTTGTSNFFVDASPNGIEV